MAPVLVIESADMKTVEDIVTEISTRTAEVQKADREMLERLRRWGRLVPFAFLRRAMVRSMFASPARRRKAAGTFQVSVVPADWAISSAFVATGVLIAGAVRGRVVPFEGQCVVRPTHDPYAVGGSRRLGREGGHAFPRRSQIRARSGLFRLESRLAAPLVVAEGDFQARRLDQTVCNQSFAQKSGWPSACR